MTTIYHGTDQSYDGMPQGQWTWWTTDINRAKAYGDRVIEHTASLRLVHTTAESGRGFLSDLCDAGIDVRDMDDLYDEDMDIEYEPHQVITDRRQSAVLAQRILDAGYDGIAHWEDHPAAGEGMVIALARI